MRALPSPAFEAALLRAWHLMDKACETVDPERVTRVRVIAVGLDSITVAPCKPKAMRARRKAGRTSWRESRDETNEVVVE